MVKYGKKKTVNKLHIEKKTNLECRQNNGNDDFPSKLDVTGIFTTRQHAAVSQERKDDGNEENICQDMALNKSSSRSTETLPRRLPVEHQETVGGHKTIQLQRRTYLQGR